MRGTELRAVVRGRDFRWLYATRVVSQCTDGLFQVALAGYILFSPERQASAGKVAAAFAVVLLPYSVLGPFVGVFLDRWSRRQVLVWAPVLRSGLVVGTAGLLLAGHDGVGFFLAVLVVMGVNRFFLSALSAALPHVVERELLVTANAFAVTSGTVAAFAGGGLGYLLRLAFGGGQAGTAGILLSAAGLYLLAGLVATTLGRERLGPDLDTAPPQTREALGNVLRGLGDGARYIGRTRKVALALGAIAFHRFWYGVTLIMTLLLYRYLFSDDVDEGLNRAAGVLAVSGIGYFLAAVLTPLVVPRIGKDAWIAGLLGSAAVALAVFGLPFANVPWMVLAFLLGVVSQGVKLSVDAILQETVPDAYLGRVFAVYDMLFNAMFVGAAALAAVSVPPNGRSHLMLFIVIAAYAIGATAYWTSAIRRPAPTA
ncbi:MFS transporter [Thermomonospora cellulosilytica]|uniref:MFS family permease n=1 Tax=Thermomonospora cellulosilytica TaxID=1411118 RepID=A0A7W3MUK1_9ACTN|nr:MFS transporter [Thermomonospora cellulosilytica]MBA9002133.1 MFS family permease [Thermomonospora cellulosilytica]